MASLTKYHRGGERGVAQCKTYTEPPKLCIEQNPFHQQNRADSMSPQCAPSVGARTCTHWTHQVQLCKKTKKQAEGKNCFSQNIWAEGTCTINFHIFLSSRFCT